MLATFSPLGTTMTAIILDCHTTVETRLVNQLTGDTLQTAYHDSIDAAVNHVEQFNPDKVEYDTL